MIVRYIQKDELARGHHATLSPYPEDVSNRAIKDIMLASGLSTADDADFLGFAPLQTVLKNKIVTVNSNGVDDTDAIRSAIASVNYGVYAGSVYLPDAFYIITSKISLPVGVTISGSGKHSTQLLHAFNGDMFDIGSQTTLQNIWLNGQGATYTGKGILFTGTQGKQSLLNIRVDDFDGPCLDFEVAAGAQSFVINAELHRRNSATTTDRYAVVISPTQQLTAIPHSFIGIQTQGDCAFDFGGGNNIYITNSFLGDLKYTPDSRSVEIQASRLANDVALTVDGHNNTIIGCTILPQITIAAGADNNVIGPCSFNTLPVIDNSGNLNNVILTYNVLSLAGNQVVGARGAAVANATGGSVIDVEGRAALNALLARVRTHGLIAP